jgi:hypothetical protein
MNASDIIKVINGAGFVAVPFLAALFGLDWYFTRRGKKTRSVFIAVGGVLSAVLYSYLAWTEPSPLLVRTSIVSYFALAALSVVFYYGLYDKYNGAADPPAPSWLLPSALLSYICLLSAIGIFCAAALARHDYMLVAGQVVSGVAPIANATVILQDANYNSLRETSTNAKGRFLLTLKYSSYVDKLRDHHPTHLLVQADGFIEQDLDFDGHPNENVRIALTKRK